MGLKVFKNINNSGAIRVVEGVVFTMKDMKEYLEIFENIKRDGILSNTSGFDDEVWNLDDGLRVYRLVFEFNKDMYNIEMKRRNIPATYDEFMNSIKCFVLLLYKKVSLHNILATFTVLRDICMKSYIFNSENIDNIAEVEPNKLHTYRRFFTLEYLQFFPFVDERGTFTSAYREILENCKVQYSKRKLGSYESMFKFNEIIDEFWSEGDEELKKKYFPIVLWWKISTIIPLRTIEFTVIPKDCCYIKDDKYYIIINRSNQKGKKSDNARYSQEERFSPQHLEITKDIYDLIMEYKNFVDGYDDIENFYGEYQVNVKSIIERRKYLLSNRGLWKYLSNLGKYFNSRKAHQEYLNADLLNKLLNDFLIEVVEEAKGISVVEKSDITNNLAGNEIDKVQLMDTRHFAFANMALQGVSPITMKYMGGHKDIDSAFHYYSHLPLFVKSYTYSLSKRLSYKRIRNNDKNHGDFILNLNIADEKRRTLHMKRLFNSEDRAFRLINGEKCFSPNFPKSCLKVDNECSECEYWHPSKKKLDEVKLKIDEINREINSTLMMIKYLVQDYTHIISPDMQITQQSNKLNSLVNVMAQLMSDYII